MRYGIALEQGGWVIRDAISGQAVTPAAGRSARSRVLSSSRQYRCISIAPSCPNLALIDQRAALTCQRPLARRGAQGVGRLVALPFPTHHAVWGIRDSES